MVGEFWAAATVLTCAICMVCTSAVRSRIAARISSTHHLSLFCGFKGVFQDYRFRTRTKNVNLSGKPLRNRAAISPSFFLRVLPMSQILAAKTFRSWPCCHTNWWKAMLHTCSSDAEWCCIYSFECSIQLLPTLPISPWKIVIVRTGWTW